VCVCIFCFASFRSGYFNNDNDDVAAGDDDDDDDDVRPSSNK